MYPRVDESDTHAAAHGHPAYAMPAAIPNYGAPPPYVAPYTTNSMRTPMAIRTQRWSTSLCHCLDDPANCVVTCFCPCVTFGQIADILNRGSSSCTCEGAIYTLLAFLGVPCLYSCYYRSKLRAQYDLPEAPCMDCLVHFCCETCALCQEYRELRNRGFDLSIGWEANAERVQGVTIPPPVSSAMTR